MTSKYSPWRNRLAIVATGFAALGAFTVAKAEAIVPSVSVFNAHTAEGNVGNKSMPFSVKLSAPSPAAQWVQLQPGVGGPTPATANTDFNAAGPYLVNFAPNETAKVVNVPIKGDTLDENDETFTLKVVAHGPGIAVADGEGIGSITDDDNAPVITIDDVNKKEGTNGITAFTFTAKLSTISGKTVKVNAAGSSVSAHIPEDLTAGPATLTFNPGVTARTYTAHVNADGKVEPNETFNVLLSGAVNAGIADSVGVGTIVNDDFLVIDPNPKPQPQPQPQPQPDPQPQPNPGNGAGNGGGVVSGGGVGGSIDGGGGDTLASGTDAASGEVAPGGSGEQALGPNAAADTRTQRSIDWTAAALLTLLGICLSGMVVALAMYIRNRREDRRTI